VHSGTRSTGCRHHKSLKVAGKAKESYEAHFNAAFDEAITSGKRPDEAAKPSLTVDDYIDGENVIVEYNSNECVLETKNRLHLSL
jgi:hypothetical protein